jgi:hypothetical protein
MVEQRAIAKAQKDAYDRSRDMAGGLTDEEKQNRGLASVDPSDESEPSTTTPDEVDLPGPSEEQIEADLASSRNILAQQEADRQASKRVLEQQEKDRRASLAQLEAEREDIPPTDRGTTVEGRDVPLVDAKPGPEDTSVRVGGVPVEPERTPDQQLAEVQAALPKGDTPRIDTGKTDEQLVGEREEQSRDSMLKATQELLTDIDTGKLSFEEAIDASNEMAEVYGNLVGPNYRTKLYRAIDKAFNVRPEADPTPEQPYSLDPENLPVVEPNMLTNRTNNAKILRDEFTKLGYSKNQIEAFVATAISESDLKANASNKRGEDSLGLFQFNRRRGEGEGFEVSQLQNPYFQIMKIHDAISTRPELAFFKNNPDASADDLIVDFNKNYIRPAGIRGQEKQDERKAYIPYARRELDKLEQDQVQLTVP